MYYDFSKRKSLEQSRQQRAIAEAEAYPAFPFDKEKYSVPCDYEQNGNQHFSGSDRTNPYTENEYAYVWDVNPAMPPPPIPNFKGRVATNQLGDTISTGSGGGHLEMQQQRYTSGPDEPAYEPTKIKRPGYPHPGPSGVPIQYFEVDPEIAHAMGHRIPQGYSIEPSSESAQRVGQSEGNLDRSENDFTTNDRVHKLNSMINRHTS